jgi:plasmid stability protein
MARLVVRQLEDEIKIRLKRRAESHGRSTEAEVREILRNAAINENRTRARLGARIAARFRGAGLSEDLPLSEPFPVREFEATWSPLDRSRERPLFVTE